MSGKFLRVGTPPTRRTPSPATTNISHENCLSRYRRFDRTLGLIGSMAYGGRGRVHITHLHSSPIGHFDVGSFRMRECRSQENVPQGCFRSLVGARYHRRFDLADRQSKSEGVGEICGGPVRLSGTLRSRLVHSHGRCRDHRSFYKRCPFSSRRFHHIVLSRKFRT